MPSDVVERAVLPGVDRLALSAKTHSLRFGKERTVDDRGVEEAVCLREDERGAVSNKEGHWPAKAAIPKKEAHSHKGCEVEATAD